MKRRRETGSRGVRRKEEGKGEGMKGGMRGERKGKGKDGNERRREELEKDKK